MDPTEQIDPNESKKEKSTYIYALQDPRDWSIRYIGKTDDCDRRFYSHTRAQSPNKELKKFVFELRSLGLKPRMSILQKCSYEQWQDWERFWITTTKEAGEKLVNLYKSGASYQKKKRSPRPKEVPENPAIMIANWIKTAMMLSGLNATTLSRKSGINVMTVHNIIHHKQKNGCRFDIVVLLLSTCGFVFGEFENIVKPRTQS